MEYSNDNLFGSEMMIYTTEDGLTKIETTFDGDTVWLSADQMAELFQRDKSTISRHIKNIFTEGELVRDSVVAKFATTATDGKTYQVEYYNLDVIISVGYRVKSKRGTQFRIWATGILKEYMRKGFALDDERLKNLGGGGYFKELLERIRDIRASEKVFYRQVLEIYATSIDYDPHAEISVQFFRKVQNKIHYAIHGQTAAEVIYTRADAEKEFMGLTTFAGRHPTLKEAVVAKNYLNEKELDDLADEIRNDIHSDYYLADLIRKGVAYHVGYLPLHVRTKIEELYRVKKIKAIFCTSTIIEGVNLPADNLIAVSCNIGNAGTMSAVEFKNMLGRVGRIEYNLYGNVFIIRQEKHTSMDTIKELLIKDVPDQKVALTESLSLCNKMTIVENLAKGNTQIPHPDNVKDEEYNLMRKTSLILLRDIMKDRQSVVREQFNSVLNEESIAKIKSHFTDTTAKKAEPDDDINVSPDQTERLVYAINEEGLKYPDLVNGNVEYNDLRDFLWKLNDVFKWSIYEKKTLGNGNKINYYAVILTRWMNSYGLKQLLQDTLNHNLQHGEMVQLPDRSVVPYNNSQQHKNIVIGDTLQIIENVILFSIANYFLRFSNEYKRLKTNGQPFKNDWYEYVEYGSTNELTIFLQRNGFERDTADYIKKHQDQYVIKVNGEYKLKPSILECDKRSVVDDIKDIAYNIPELFFRQ